MMRFVSATIFSAVVLAASLRSPHTVADRREDLAMFKRDFFARDQAYSPAARAEASRRLQLLDAGIDNMSDVKFVLSLSQIVALADNGHTAMFVRGNADELAQVGLHLAVMGGDFIVVMAESAHADLLGGALIAIDGHPVAQLRDSARTLTGGIAAWRDRAAPQFLQSPGQLHALGMAQNSSQATYRFRMRDGKVRDVTLAPIASHTQSFHSGIGMEPGNAPPGWQTLLPLAYAPWTLRDGGDLMRRRDAPEMDAMVIQLRTNVDGAEPIATFLDNAEAARKAAGRKNIVLDMRGNGGGNLQLTRAWMSTITSQLPAGGRIVVLMGPGTFSAAISSTAYLKQAGGPRVVLAGDPPGDRLRFWAEGQPITLPHSGAVILMATQRHDYLTGCKGFTDCHGPVAQYPIALAPLDPEVPAPWTIATYAAGRDPGMEAAQRVLMPRK